MSWQAIVQALVLVAMLVIAVPLLGRYMAAVYGVRKDGSAPGDRFFNPIERFIYKVCRIDHKREQRWNVYALSLVAFSVMSVLFLYALLRLQGNLFFNPTDRSNMSPMGSFNAAISFVTNTNWQWFSGEVAISHLTPDDRLHRAELRVCCCRHGCGDRSDPRDHQGAFTHHRQLLGRPDQDRRADPGAARAGLHGRAHLARRGPEPARQHRGDDGRPVERGHHTGDSGWSVRLAGGDQGTRHERRRTVQRQLCAPVREPERVHRHPGDLHPPAHLAVAGVDVRPHGG